MFTFMPIPMITYSSADRVFEPPGGFHDFSTSYDVVGPSDLGHLDTTILNGRTRGR